MTSKRSHHYAIIHPETQRPVSRNQQKKLSSFFLNINHFGRLVGKTFFRKRDTDSEFPQCDNDIEFTEDHFVERTDRFAQGKDKHVRDETKTGKPNKVKFADGIKSEGSDIASLQESQNSESGKFRFDESSYDSATMGLDFMKNDDDNEHSPNGGITLAHCKGEHTVYDKSEVQGITISKAEVDKLCTLTQKEQKESQGDEINHLTMNSGVYPSSSEFNLTSDVDSLNENVVSSDTIASTASDNFNEIEQLWNEKEISLSSGCINSDHSLSNHSISLINSLRSSEMRQGSEEIIARSSKLLDSPYCLRKSKNLALDSLESVDPKVSLPSETVLSTDKNDQYLSSPKTSSNTDSVLDSLQIRGDSSCVPSLKNLPAYNREPDDNRDRKLNGSEENNWNKTSFPDAGSVVVNDKPRLSKDDSNSECSDVKMTVGCKRKEKKLMCNLDSFESVLQTTTTTPSEKNHRVSEESHDDETDLPLAIRDTPEEPDIEKIYDEEEPVHMSHSELMELYGKESRVQLKGRKGKKTSTFRSKKTVLDNLKEIRNCGWYWGPLSYDEAISQLMNKPHGSFLVRDSHNELYLLSLSINLNGCVYHMRIEHNNGKFDFFECVSSGYSSIKELIEESVRKSSMAHSFSFRGSFAPVDFLHPVSRFLQMQSLQHICRFKILENVRRDHIENLPIPTSIKDYLREYKYYVENLEC